MSENSEEQFLVAALSDDGASWSTPVRVRCTRCSGYSPLFGGAANLPEGQVPGEAPLHALAAWAENHTCGPALPPDVWLRAAELVKASMSQAMSQSVGGLDANEFLDASGKAFAVALLAVWPELRQEVLSNHSARPAGGE